MSFAVRLGASSVCAALFIAVGLAGCSPAVGVAGSSLPGSIRTGVEGMTAAPEPPEHLYVQAGDTMWQYPLVAGIPSSTPSNSLTVVGARYAVGSDGSVYSIHSSPYIVDVYAPGASGIDPPIRTLSVGTCCTFAVDLRGYVFVMGPFGNTASVYAPGAHGNDSPVRTFIAQSSSAFAAFDQRGNLYLLWGSPKPRNVTVYADVTRRPHAIATFCSRRPASWIATDDAGHVFLTDVPGSHKHTSIAVLAADDTTCPGEPLRHISAKGAESSDGYFGLGALGSHLFAARDGSSTSVVFTFDIQRGRQTPLGVVSVPAHAAWAGVGR